jgi:glutathione synthase/RimK-type ligase-like ATP-grasp enzyme
MEFIMKNKSIILIIASSNDIHADRICSELSSLNANYLRIYPDSLYPDQYQITFTSNYKEPSALTIDHIKIIPSSIHSILCRDFSLPECPDDAPITEHLRYAESNSALHGFFRTLEDHYWMNPPWCDEMADNKLYQQHCAHQEGFKIPQSLTTNNPETFIQFYNNCNHDVIIKQLSEISLIDDSELLSQTDETQPGKAYGFYTNKINNSFLDKIEDIKYAPCLFQKHIHKQADIRTTYIDGEVFSAKINSQIHEKTKTDFRHIVNLPLEKYSLPKTLHALLRSLLERWGIRFAACDFILTENDELIFIEANVAGNWLWIEETLKLEITKSIANHLIGSR